MSAFSISIPESGSSSSEVYIKDSSIVLVGANGSGKSRLAAWIELHQIDKHATHRITAQKSLLFNKESGLVPLQKAEDALSWGKFGKNSFTGDSPEDVKQRQFRLRYGGDGVAILLEDFDHVVALLLARKRKRDEEFVEHVLVQGSGSKEVLPLTTADLVIKLWSSIIPRISIRFAQDDIVATSDGRSYSAAQMSDGERVLFYILSQSQLAAPGTVFIVDEPEIHLHKSLIAKTWSLIEESRPDCCFVYCTQDLDFAATRVGSRKIWVKGYDGNVWEWVDVTDEWPSSLLLEILGSRVSSVLVEGEYGSLDERLFSKLLPEKLIIPRGGCNEVITAAKSLASLTSLHQKDVSGIVDRDFRCDAEIASLRAKGIKVLDVAEVENVFCLPIVIEAVGRKINATEADLVLAKKEVKDSFRSALQQQIFAKSNAELKYQLTLFGGRGNSKAELVASLQSFNSQMDVGAIFDQAKNAFDSAFASDDLAQMLKLLNRKNTFKGVAQKLGLTPNRYVLLALSELDQNPTLRSGLIALIN